MHNRSIDPLVDIDIRTAAGADLADVAQLVRARVGGTMEAWIARLRGEIDSETAGVWVADADGETVGYGRASYFDRPADAGPHTAPAGFYLGGLFVAQSHRRRNVGRALTAVRLAWVTERAEQAWFFTNARNEASLALHRSLGFREVTRDFCYPGVEFDGGVGVLCTIDLTAQAIPPPA